MVLSPERMGGLNNKLFKLFTSSSFLTIFAHRSWRLVVSSNLTIFVHCSWKPVNSFVLTTSEHRSWRPVISFVLTTSTLVRRSCQLWRWRSFALTISGRQSFQIASSSLLTLTTFVRQSWKPVLSFVLTTPTLVRRSCQLGKSVSTQEAHWCCLPIRIAYALEPTCLRLLIINYKLK